MMARLVRAVENARYDLIFVLGRQKPPSVAPADRAHYSAGSS